MLCVSAWGDKEKKGGNSLEDVFVRWTRGYKLGLNKFRLEINGRFLAAGGWGILGNKHNQFYEGQG